MKVKLKVEVFEFFFFFLPTSVKAVVYVMKENSLFIIW